MSPAEAFPPPLSMVICVYVTLLDALVKLMSVIPTMKSGKFGARLRHVNATTCSNVVCSKRVPVSLE